MILKTERLLLRPWRESDAESLHEYAKNPNVGPAAGWPAHTSVDESLNIIRFVLSFDESYAVTLGDTDAAIGSIALLFGDRSRMNLPAGEAELGYWLGEPFWGRGYIPEAARELMRHAFEEMGVSVLWCGHFDGNGQSKRVIEKCGFRFHHTEADREWPLINAVRTQHMYRYIRSGASAGRCGGEPVYSRQLGRWRPGREAKLPSYRPTTLR